MCRAFLLSRPQEERGFINIYQKKTTAAAQVVPCSVWAGRCEVELESDCSKTGLIYHSIYSLAAVRHAHGEHLSTTEKDTSGDVLWVWCYPSVTAELRDLLLRKSCLTDENKLLHTFVFGQYKRSWFYITTVEVQESPVLKKVGPGPFPFQQSLRKTFGEHPLAFVWL